MSQHTGGGSIRTARETVEAAFDLLLAKDMIGFAHLWAVDGTMDFPFAPAYSASHLEGREAIIEYLRDYPARIDLHGFRDVVIHETTDAEVVVVEMQAEGTVVATGLPYDIRYIAVIAVRDGEIASYRDYW